MPPWPFFALDQGLAPLTLPLAGQAVRAGFPSPAEDFHVERLDLTAILVTHPQATFLLRLSGESMAEAGLYDGDLLVVNRALKPVHQDVVIAVVDGEFTSPDRKRTKKRPPIRLGKGGLEGFDKSGYCPISVL